MVDQLRCRALALSLTACLGLGACQSDSGGRDPAEAGTFIEKGIPASAVVADRPPTCDIPGRRPPAGMLIGLDAESGRVEWSQEIGGTPGLPRMVVHQAVVVTATLAERQGIVDLTAWQVQDGRKLWSVPLADVVSVEPLVAGQALIARTTSSLVAIDLSAGRELWRHDPVDLVLGLAGSLLMVADTEGVKALEVISGAEIWSLGFDKIAMSAIADAAINADTLILAGAAGQVTEVGAADGSVRREWTDHIPTGVTPTGARLAIVDDVLVEHLVGTDVTVAVDMNSHTGLWLKRGSSDVDVAAVDDDQVLVFSDSRLELLKAKTGETEPGWPVRGANMAVERIPDATWAVRPADRLTRRKNLLFTPDHDPTKAASELWIVDLDTGGVIWRAAADARVPVISGRRFYSVGGGNLLGFSVEPKKSNRSGEAEGIEVIPLWDPVPIEGGVVGSPAAFDDDVVIQVSDRVDPDSGCATEDTPEIRTPVVENDEGSPDDDGAGVEGAEVGAGNSTTSTTESAPTTFGTSTTTMPKGT